jgi:hypothetical protein
MDFLSLYISSTYFDVSLTPYQQARYIARAYQLHEYSLSSAMNEGIDDG